MEGIKKGRTRELTPLRPRCGVGSWARFSIPQQIATSTALNFTEVSAGRNHTCAVTQAVGTSPSKIYCWGAKLWGLSGLWGLGLVSAHHNRDPESCAQGGTLHSS